MLGAGVLASHATYRVGSGYVTWVTEALPPGEAIKYPNLLTSDFDAVFRKKISAFVVGPGLGVDRSTLNLILRLKKMTVPVVLDADALTVVAQEKVQTLPANWILTPHSGELSRLLGISSEEIERDRFTAVRSAAKSLDAWFC